MTAQDVQQPQDENQTFHIKQPHSLSPRIKWLRDFYFQGLDRKWNNEWTCWTTGTPWDVLYDEITFHIVPESYPFFQAFRSSTAQVGRPVELPPRQEAQAWRPVGVWRRREAVPRRQRRAS